MSFRDRFGRRYPEGERPNDMLKDSGAKHENPFDTKDPHWHTHDPTHDNRRYENGDWWNWWALVALVLVTAWVMMSGFRGVALALIFVIGVSILVLERSRTWVVSILTIVITLIVAAIYFFIAWQTM